MTPQNQMGDGNSGMSGASGMVNRTAPPAPPAHDDLQQETLDLLLQEDLDHLHLEVNN